MCFVRTYRTCRGISLLVQCTVQQFIRVPYRMYSRGRTDMYTSYGATIARGWNLNEMLSVCVSVRLHEPNFASLPSPLVSSLIAEKRGNAPQKCVSYKNKYN